MLKIKQVREKRHRIRVKLRRENGPSLRDTVYNATDRLHFAL